MRLGGFFQETYDDPEEWIRILKSKAYDAAYSPFSIPLGGSMPSQEEIRDYKKAAEDADIIIAEVGAWNRNPISEDDAEREQGIRESIALLDLADHLGARCMVNIAGRRNNRSDHFSDDTFHLIVETARKIIDAVKPKQTFFTLELVTSIFPYSIDSYLELIKAIDRRAFGVHLDPVNIIDNAYKYYRNAEFLRECFAKLGPYVKSCHAKDVLLTPGQIIHIDETRPGLGVLDYRTFIHEINRVDPDIPLMMEHLDTDDEYSLAAEYIRSCIED